MASRTNRLLAVGLAAALFAPVAAGAREASKIRLFMENLSVGKEKGLLRSSLVPARAEMNIAVLHLAPNHEHILYGDGVEIARFTTNASGGASLRLDLFATGSLLSPTFDPRGRFITVNDGTNDVLAAWVYASPSDDPPRPSIDEVTSLAADPVAMPAGQVDARYKRLPSGLEALDISLRHVAAGTYDVLVDDQLVATVTPNASGFALVDLRRGPGAHMGSNRPHLIHGALTGDPRGEKIDVKLNNVTQFSGDMLAQIPGL